MASEGPSWADQWGSGGIGAMDEADDHTKTQKEAADKRKGGFIKVKAAALAGAQKVKNGTSMGIKWVRTKSQKKSPRPDEQS